MTAIGNGSDMRGSAPMNVNAIPTNPAPCSRDTSSEDDAMAHTLLHECLVILSLAAFLCMLAVLADAIAHSPMVAW